MPARSGKKLNDGRKNGVLWWLRPDGHASKDDVDVDAGAQDIMFGCVSEQVGLRHVSHTPDGNSFEEETDRRARMVICGG